MDIRVATFSDDSAISSGNTNEHERANRQKEGIENKKKDT